MGRICETEEGGRPCNHHQGRKVEDGRDQEVHQQCIPRRSVENHRHGHRQDTTGNVKIWWRRQSQLCQNVRHPKAEGVFREVSGSIITAAIILTWMFSHESILFLFSTHRFRHPNQRTLERRTDVPPIPIPQMTTVPILAHPMTTDATCRNTSTLWNLSVFFDVMQPVEH